MLSNIKATLLKYSEMGWEELTKLKAWMKRNPTGFDVESFANPTLRIVQVTNAAGQMICYCPIQQAVILNPPVHNPQATSVEMFAAGSIIEGEIARQAELSGASKLLMVLPENTPSFPGERWVRVVERAITPAVITHGIGCSATTSATQHLN